MLWVRSRWKCLGPSYVRGKLVRVALVWSVIAGFTAPLAAQVPLGFRVADTAAQRALEARLLAVPDTATPRRLTADLSARPHMSGTPAQATTGGAVVGRPGAAWIEACGLPLEKKMP